MLLCLRSIGALSCLPLYLCPHNLLATMSLDNNKNNNNNSNSNDNNNNYWIRSALSNTMKQIRMNHKTFFDEINS